MRKLTLNVGLGRTKILWLRSFVTGQKLEPNLVDRAQMTQVSIAFTMLFSLQGTPCPRKLDKLG